MEVKYELQLFSACQDLHTL